MKARPVGVMTLMSPYPTVVNVTTIIHMDENHVSSWQPEDETQREGHVAQGYEVYELEGHSWL